PRKRRITQFLQSLTASVENLRDSHTYAWRKPADGGILMKTISIFLALINSITAGILLLLTLSSVEVEPFQILWLIAKTVAGTIVILIGIVTWLGGAGAARSGLLPMSS